MEDEDLLVDKQRTVRCSLWLAAIISTSEPMPLPHTRGPAPLNEDVAIVLDERKGSRCCRRRGGAAAAAALVRLTEAVPALRHDERPNVGHGRLTDIAMVAFVSVYRDDSDGVTLYRLHCFAAKCRQRSHAPHDSRWREDPKLRGMTHPEDAVAFGLICLSVARFGAADRSILPKSYHGASPSTIACVLFTDHREQQSPWYIE